MNSKIAEKIERVRRMPIEELCKKYNCQPEEICLGDYIARDQDDKVCPYKVILGFANFENSQVESLGNLEVVYGRAMQDLNGLVLDLNRNQGTITITGCFPGVQCGETLVVKGNWTEHNQYGRQFQCIQFESTLPSDVHGIRQYLSSGLIHGIGKEYANKIVEFFVELKSERGFEFLFSSQ